MKICIASGKGGTGKTLLSVNLACQALGSVTLLDCDVEEPNVHLFLPPGGAVQQETVTCPHPVVDVARCTACGACVKACLFHALARVRGRLFTFPELCHGCGRCLRVCSSGALAEAPRGVGVLRTWSFEQVRVGEGRLNIGEGMAPAVIKALLARSVASTPVLVDAPPGTSCSVVAAMEACDGVLLVTEPTPFGLHDLTLAVAVARQLKKPFGVILNRADGQTGTVEAYCQAENIALLAKLPLDRRIAEASSKGQLVSRVLPEYAPFFQQVWRSMERMMACTNGSY